MFFFKSSSIVALLALASSVFAHNAFEPALGVKGATVRNDVKRPSTQSQCGNGVNAAQSLAASTPAVANNGVVTLTARNFNGGRDGSRQIAKLALDTTGTGTSFTALQASAVTKNGQAAPASTGTEQLTVQLPAGTACTGGADGATCLLSVTSAGGFGNCIAVSTGGAAGAAGAGAAGAAGAGAGAAAGAAGAAGAAATNTAAAAGAADTAAAAAATDTAAAAAATQTTAAGTAAGTGNGQGRGNGRNRNGAGRNRNGGGGGRGNGNGNGNGAAAGGATATGAAAATGTAAAGAAATDTAAAAASTDAAAAAAAATETAAGAAAAATATGATGNHRRFVPNGTRAPRALRAMEKMEQLS